MPGREPDRRTREREVSNRHKREVERYGEKRQTYVRNKTMKYHDPLIEAHSSHE